MIEILSSNTTSKEKKDLVLAIRISHKNGTKPYLDQANMKECITIIKKYKWYKKDQFFDKVEVWWSALET